uniref:Uncharacterized protein n=1 Tax=Arundo donax TaxID=35708 RepID=A0A0A9CS35_ARUDO
MVRDIKVRPVVSSPTMEPSPTMDASRQCFWSQRGEAHSSRWRCARAAPCAHRLLGRLPSHGPSYEVHELPVQLKMPCLGKTPAMGSSNFSVRGAVLSALLEADQSMQMCAVDRRRRQGCIARSYHAIS